MERTLGIANTHPESCPRQAKVAGRGHDPEGRVELPPTRTVQATVSRRRRSYLILKRVGPFLLRGRGRYTMANREII